MSLHGALIQLPKFLQLLSFLAWLLSADLLHMNHASPAIVLNEKSKTNPDAQRAHQHEPVVSHRHVPLSSNGIMSSSASARMCSAF
jgi:hypothetical protein